ncbi:hypothetical protein NSE01_12340 [Novosphingobium sediminis]|uniref:Uncharacterized protein n=1 Tax=Novosphingobium sediminis TaxID=707214 RepID=A0A512AI91_9SPHN|nr:hypothetical protein NSE01_12340 [Novosphingobium sediminis]
MIDPELAQAAIQKRHEPLLANIDLIEIDRLEPPQRRWTGNRRLCQQCCEQRGMAFERAGEWVEEQGQCHVVKGRTS